jgi:hypothetical protein
VRFSDGNEGVRDFSDTPMVEPGTPAIRRVSA